MARLGIRKRGAIRRRCQFGLRSMLLVVCLLASGLSVAGAHLEAMRRENAAISRLEALGAVVSYRAQLLDEKPRGPEWLRAAFGEHIVADGVYLDFQPCTHPLDVNELKLLMDIRRVFAIRLGPARVNDAFLNVLCRVTSLEQLSAERAALSDAMLGRLSTLPNIRGLNITGTAITDASIPAICRMRNLLYIEAQGTGISAGGAARLRKHLPQCSVRCGGCR